MNEDVPVIPLVIGLLALGPVRLRGRPAAGQAPVDRCTFDREESEVAETLEAVVRNGVLKPYLAAFRRA